MQFHLQQPTIPLERKTAKWEPIKWQPGMVIKIHTAENKNCSAILNINPFKVPSRKDKILHLIIDTA
jgi:hypothetical protein